MIHNTFMQTLFVPDIARSTGWIRRHGGSCRGKNSDNASTISHLTTGLIHKEFHNSMYIQDVIAKKRKSGQYNSTHNCEMNFLLTEALGGKCIGFVFLDHVTAVLQKGSHNKSICSMTCAAIGSSRCNLISHNNR